MEIKFENGCAKTVESSKCCQAPIDPILSVDGRFISRWICSRCEKTILSYDGRLMERNGGTIIDPNEGFDYFSH